MRKIVMMLMIAVVVFSNDLHAEPLAYNDKIFDTTIGEAKKYSNDGNPMDMLIDYRKKYGNDVFDNYYYIPIGPGENEGIDLYIGDANYDINEEVQEGINKIIEKYRANDYNSNILSYIIMFVVFLVVSIILYIKSKKRIVLIIPILFLIVLILPTLIKNKQLENCISLYAYLKNKGIEISNNVIKSELTYPFGKMDIAYEINRYIEDLNAILYEKNSDEPFFVDELSEALGDKYLGKDDKQVFYNYLEKEKMLYKGINENTECINSIREIQPILYYDIVDKMIDIAESDLDNDKFMVKTINEINKEIHFKEPEDKENVFHYAERLNAFKNAQYIRNFKDWYIDGVDKIIELPYGMYLHYKAPQLLKKDVKKIVCVNINELDLLSEDNILKVFYLDSNDNLKYDFTICKFIEEDGKQKLYYEPYTIMYDVRCASTVFSMNKELEYIDNRPTEVLVKKY